MKGFQVHLLLDLTLRYKKMQCQFPGKTFFVCKHLKQTRGTNELAATFSREKVICQHMKISIVQ